MKIDWKRKLSSRKLWLAVATFVSMLLVFFGASDSVATQVASIIMQGGVIIAYIIAEGWADSANGGSSNTQIIAEGIEIAEGIGIEPIELRTAPVNENDIKSEG